jgi:transposase
LDEEFYLLFVDESTLGLYPVLRRCWVKQGQQKRIDTPGKTQWHHLFGAYHFMTDGVFTLGCEHKNSDSFIAFLDYLARQLPTDKPLLLVLDNASIHHSAATQAAFALFEGRILPLFLPAYCSTLNPIERFWRHLKEQSCANTLFPSIQALIDSVQATLHSQNDLANPFRFTICKNLQ